MSENMGFFDWIRKHGNDSVQYDRPEWTKNGKEWLDKVTNSLFKLPSKGQFLGWIFDSRSGRIVKLYKPLRRNPARPSRGTQVRSR